MRLRTSISQFRNLPLSRTLDGASAVHALRAARRLRAAHAAVVDVNRLPWVEIDFPEDLERAQQLLPLIEALDREDGVDLP